MEKEFVTYEQALALKELGFDEDCLAFYNGKFLNSTDYNFDNGNSKDIGLCITAPLKQQVFRWFREKYELHHMIIIDSDTNTFDAGVFGELVTPFLEEDTIFHTYEEAENACIDKLLEIVNSQKDIDVPLSKQPDK
jgi:hypothetical protein